MKPTWADIALICAWVMVLLAAMTATSLRLATGEGWLAKVAATFFGGEIPFDLAKDHDRPIGFGEVAPGLFASVLLVLTPVLAAGGLGIGKRGWTIAAWVCLLGALPLILVDATNVRSPSFGDLSAAFGIGVGAVALLGGVGLAGGALVALARGSWHAHRNRDGSARGSPQSGN